jgi:hypothetical protein
MGTRGYEWHINESKLSFLSVHSSLYDIKAVYLLILWISSSIFLHSLFKASNMLNVVAIPVLSFQRHCAALYLKPRLLLMDWKGNLISLLSILGPYFQPSVPLTHPLPPHHDLSLSWLLCRPFPSFKCHLLRDNLLWLPYVKLLLISHLYSSNFSLLFLNLNITYFSSFYLWSKRERERIFFLFTFTPKL